MNTKSNANLPDYLSYPKQFIPYKWYKPLLTLLLGLIIWLLLGAPLTFLTPGALEAIKNGTSVAAAVKGGLRHSGHLLSAGRVSYLRRHSDVLSHDTHCQQDRQRASVFLLFLLARRLQLGGFLQKPRRIRRPT